MKKILFIITLMAGLLGFQSCSKTELEVTNLNQPSTDVLNSEAGVLAYAKGFYKIGFGDQYVGSLDDGLGMGMLLIVQGFHEGMGDNVFIPWGNQSFKFADNPISVTLDNGTKVPNPIGGGQKVELQLRNDRAYGASNSFLPEWTYMYFLNNASNVLLSKLDATTFSGDAATKKKVLQGWAYLWKGYAYSRIGSMYIAGVITDKPNATNGNFVPNTAMVTEGIKNLDAAKAIFAGMSANDAFTSVITNIIPAFMQTTAEFGAISPSAIVKNINTFEARTLLVNKRTKEMSASDWNAILTLANAGLGATDYPFLVKTFSDNSKSVIDKDWGSFGSYTAYNDTYKISERFIQDFNAGDKRFDNNFELAASAVVNQRGRGITFGTRYEMIDGGIGNGAYTYFHYDYGVDNFYIGGSYEENELMKAEALMYTSKVEDGLKLLDGVRTKQGAGLAATAGTGMSQAAALEELRKERRIALFTRGLAFYDLRRMGYADPVASGGGRKNAWVLDANGNLNTKATIDYSYMSYWDVPKNELDFNPSTSQTKLKSIN
jgi:hypothetical protein